LSETWGQITADGDSAFIAMVRQALDEAKNGVPLPDLYENLPPRAFTVSQHTPANMLAAGAIIPGSKSEAHKFGIAAYGFVFDKNDLWLNSLIVAKRPHLARHITRHEIAHTLPTSDQDEADLLQLMWKQNGKHPQHWLVGKYEMRPEECRADTIAEAVSGLDSPWDDFKYYGLDVNGPDFPKVVEITLRAKSGTGTPPPDPEPQPLPDPRIVELQAQVADLTARIAAKDAAMTQGLAA
jgi:hypothetical protein